MTRRWAEATETLSRYLARACVESGEALETARKEYRSRNHRSQARAVKSKAGVRPVGNAA
jgi:hypothetical protein